MEYMYNLAFIGGGPGGYEAALCAASLGMKTILIEKDQIGGTCLNRGCIPTKVMIHSADLLREMKRAGTFGLSAENIRADLDAIQQRKTEVIRTLREGIEGRLKKSKVDLRTGIGSIYDPHTIRISREGADPEDISADYILIATGSEVSMPPIPGRDLPGVLTSDDILELSGEVPERLLIIGGGVIGMEFASAFGAFGSSVTVLEAMPRILPGLDKELSQSLKMLMKKRGAEVHEGALVKEIRRGEDGGLVCLYEEKGKPCEAAAGKILICTGRKPCTDGLFADGFSLEMNRGRIVTDGDGRTGIDSIFAIGDVSGSIMLAHAAAAAGRNAVKCMCGRAAGADISVIPSCIYTSPEIASVGLTEEQAKKEGRAAASVKYVMSANGKTVLSAGERGFIRIIYDKENGCILGAAMMCERATDMISEFTQAIVNGLTVADMQRAVYPHPTFSEGIGEALFAAGAAQK